MTNADLDSLVSGGEQTSRQPRNLWRHVLEPLKSFSAQNGEGVGNVGAATTTPAAEDSNNTALVCSHSFIAFSF